MTPVYKRALGQRNLMIAWFLAFIPVLLISEKAGLNEEVGFAIFAVVGFVLMARLLTFKCTKCGNNLFRRGPVFTPWPNRVCNSCGTDLAGKNSAS